MEIISKSEAIRRGLNYYFTGKPCKYGHIARRLLSSPHCTDCKLEKRKRYYRNNVVVEREKSRNYHYANREKALAYMREWQQHNRETVNKRNRDYRVTRREKFNELNRLWRIENHAYILYRNALRKKHIKQATPSWSNFDQIREIYAEAVEKTKTSGTQHHVDHIVPLRGKNVCGLHVENNLQVIPAMENLMKSNKLDEPRPV